MRARLRRPDHATVVAYLALFVALGGGAYAATSLRKNSVGTRQLKNGAVTGKKIAVRAVDASKVVPNSLTGRQINSATLGIVPTAANALKLGGKPLSALQTRVAGTCSGTSAISQVNADGTVACQPTGTGTITGVTAGTGLSGGGGSGAVTLSADPTAVQTRVTGTCAAHRAVSAVAQDGTVSCQAADATQGFVNQLTATGSLPTTGTEEFDGSVSTLSSGRLFVFANLGSFNQQCSSAGFVDVAISVDGTPVPGSHQRQPTQGAAVPLSMFGLTSALAAGDHTLGLKAKCQNGTETLASISGDSVLGAIRVGA